MKIEVGGTIRAKRIREIRVLSNGWLLLKTDDGKSPADFRVKLVTQTSPRVKSLTPKHAHFVIDFYGKMCASRQVAEELFRELVRVWGKERVESVLESRSSAGDLPGYPREYFLCALQWILEQEDLNYNGRPSKKQAELDAVLGRAGVAKQPSREGSELAMALFCNVMAGMHPVEAFLRAQLDVIPVKRARGAV